MSDTVVPLDERDGHESGSFWITVQSEQSDFATGLLTCRGNDHDLTADQFERLGRACLDAAAKLREREEKS